MTKKREITNEPLGFIKVPEDKSLEVLVKAINTRVVYGRREFEVTPAAGSGLRWYRNENIRWEEEPQWNF